MAIYEFEGNAPQLAASAWVAESAEVIGRVELAEDVGIWFGAVIRGDQAQPVRIGRGSNIQDCCVLHSDHGAPLTIGEFVTVGHMVMLHGCTVGDGSLIGIGAVVLNGARIGKNCLVAAGAVVTEKKEFPDNSLIVGSPAVVKRPLSTEQIASMRQNTELYIDNAKRFKASLRRIG